MNIWETIEKDFDYPDMHEPVKPGNYNLGFINAAGNEDETQFDLYPGQNLKDLTDLWKVFQKENKVEFNGVLHVEYAGIDKEMGTKLLDIWQYGLVIVRDVNDEDAAKENTYISPRDLVMILKAMKASDGYNICQCSELSKETKEFDARAYESVKDELDNILDCDSGDAEYRAIKTVLDRSTKS